MPELRRDALTGRWVIVAAERARRPRDFARPARGANAATGACPFCSGQEASTPPEVFAFRAPGSLANEPGWDLRVVPNLYPALGPEAGELEERATGLHVCMPGLGAHEVIILSPEHEEEMARLPLRHFVLMAQAFRERIWTHSRNPIVQYVHPIMNYGRDAGASREHPHAQLFALPLVPSLVESELATCESHYSTHGRCLLCDLLRQEMENGERVVWQDASFALLAPYASRAPFEMWLLPKQHRSNFERATDAELEAFGACLREAIVRLNVAVDDPPFNFWLHTAPTRRDVGSFYHWHLELVPKLGIAAGFELGTDVMVNSMPPEVAVAHLRQAGPTGG